MQSKGLSSLQDAIDGILSSQRGKDDVKTVRFFCEYDDDPHGEQPWTLVAFEGGDPIPTEHEVA